MKILIAAYPEPGHINPTLQLAKRLQSSGCEIVYAVDPTFHDYVTSRGFAVQEGPRSLLRPFSDPSYIGTMSPTEFFDSEMAKFSALLEQYRPDGVLFDRLLLLCGLQSRAISIPSICYSVQIPDLWDPISPPWTTANEPPRTARNGASNLRRWYGIANWNRRNSRHTALGRSYRAAILSTLDRRFGPVQISNAAICNVWVRGIEQVILCPREFDFPRLNSRGIHYVEPSLSLDIDNERTEATNLNPGRLEIYCSLGSQVRRIPWARDYLAAVCELISSRPGIHGSVSAGDLTDSLVRDFAGCENLSIQSWHDQNAELANADVFLTHGGMGSTKEAIFAGVPMVVTPSGHDQYGNAARTAYHHLGVHLPSESLSPKHLGAAISAATSNALIRSSIERMSATFRRYEEEPRAAALVIRLLRSG